MKDPNWEMTYSYFLDRWRKFWKFTRPIEGYESHTAILREHIGRYVTYIQKEMIRYRAETARLNDELAACRKKAKAWDTFVDDFYRHGTAVDWKAFQNLRRSVGDYRMDVDERIKPFASKVGT